jgi:hypothetical protein
MEHPVAVRPDPYLTWVNEVDDSYGPDLRLIL